MLEARGKGAESHRDVLLHLDLLDGASRAEGAEIKVLAGDGAGHDVAEAGVAAPLVCVLLQLLGWHQREAEAVLGHQQLPGEVVQLHRQLEDVLRHLERIGFPAAVPLVCAAWKRGSCETQAGRVWEGHRCSSQLIPRLVSFSLVSPLPLCPPFPAP